MATPEIISSSWFSVIRPSLFLNRSSAALITITGLVLRISEPRVGSSSTIQASPLFGFTLLIPKLPGQAIRLQQIGVITVNYGSYLNRLLECFGTRYFRHFSYAFSFRFNQETLIS